jgi:DNA repair protein RecN (Recombination protein N)
MVRTRRWSSTKSIPGIGGQTADVVGQKLKKLSRRNQVLCVTHLPQIASYADNHYSIEKRVEKGGL